MSDDQTAMAQDDARRLRQDAAEAQRVKERRDDHHGDTASPSSQHQHAVDLRAQLFRQRQPKAVIEAAINPPHKVQTAGNKMAITIVPYQPPAPGLPSLDLIQVWDTDGVTSLRDGQVIATSISSDTVKFSLYKINWCQDGAPGTRYALLSEFVADP